MKIKIFAVVVSLFMVCSVATACKDKDAQSNVTPLPVATPNPNITNTVGEFKTISGKPTATGGLSVLGSDFLKIMIEGKEIEFALSQNASRQIEFYNKDKNNLGLMRGTMITIEYHEKDLIKIADDISIVTAN